MAVVNPTVHVRYFLGETISTRACGCRPGDAGEYRFWNAWGLKVPKTCTPPRPPGHAGDYRTCAVYGGKEPYCTRSLLLRRSNQEAGLRVPARGRGGVQVLERLGLESAEIPYSPAPPGQCRGLQNLCCLCMAGRNPTRSLLLRRNNQYADLRVPARGRGGVQVLERLGPESAQNLYSPAPPGQCRGLQNLCCLCMAGRNPTRSLEKQSISGLAGARRRGAVQVLERLGPESAQNLYSPRAPRAMQAQHKARNATNVFLLVFNSEEARHAQKKKLGRRKYLFYYYNPF